MRPFTVNMILRMFMCMQKVFILFCIKAESCIIWLFGADVTLFCHSGGPAVLARSAEDGGGVWSQSVPAAVPQRVQYYQRDLLRGPCPAVCHHLLQDIQRHFTGCSEVRGWTPLQVRTHTCCAHIVVASVSCISTPCLVHFALPWVWNG